tara:strand:+ start:1478 stop:1939 length:462 start_codon:yes stop_codon:yes gene_type:complete
MAHFAQLDNNNIVTNVIVISNDDIKDNTSGLEVESFGVAVCQRLMGASTNWKQTSYNASGMGFRGNYAGLGFTYMTNVATMGVGSTDIFISPQPFPSWSIGVGTAQWYPPLDQPQRTDSEKAARKEYIWDEDAHQADTNSPKTVGWAITTAPT